jgi:hypothetical protein
MKTINMLNWLVAVAGLWEVVSPFALNYSALTVAMWNAIIAGAILIVLGVWAALSKGVSTDRTLDWISAAVGAWLAVSPVVLNYTTATTAMWNSVIVGIVALVVAGWAALNINRLTPQA